MLAWISILAFKNKDVPVGGKFVTVQDVANQHWARFGRNFFRCCSNHFDKEHSSGILFVVICH